MPPEFQFKEPPLALRTPVQKIPPSLRIPKSCPSWCIDIFWNCPISMLYYSSMNIVTHPAFGNSKCSTLLLSLQTIGITVWLPKTCNEGETCTFPLSMKILCQTKRNSSLSKFYSNQYNIAFPCKCFLEVAYYQIKLFVFHSLASYFQE